MTSTIINSFQQRRQLAQEIDALAATTSEPELLAAVRAIAHNYPVNLIVTAVVKQLDTDNSQIRGGLGHLAALLPPEEITPVLRGIVGNRQLPAQSRVTAALFLERFLGETVSQALLGDLNQTNEIAFQSLREAVDEGRRNRHILLEYVTQMRQTAQEIAFMVMQLLTRLTPSDQAELLRLIAYDDRLPVAREAVSQLEILASESSEESALHSLYNLQFTLRPELARQVERGLRKLQFSGHRYRPPGSSNWRALLSPADPFGNQTIWFVSMPQERDTNGKIFGVIMNDFYGILNSFGSDSLVYENLPVPSAVGEMVMVKADTGDTAVLLESPFEFGLWRLKRTIEAHWKAPQPRPLPAEFTLYNDWVLQSDTSSPAQELRSIFTSNESSTTESDVSSLSSVALEEVAQQLLGHPAMQGWLTQHRNLVQALRPVLATLQELPPDQLTVAVLEELDNRPERKHLLAVLAAGLRAQAAWLHIAGSPQSAELAVTLARATEALPPRQNPLLARMINATLRHSAGNNQSG